MDSILNELGVTREMQVERRRELVSRQARVDNLIEHMRAEQDNDINRLAATISPDPCWNLHPIGFWSGWDAVCKMYRMNFPFEPEGPLEMIKGVNDPRVAHWGDDHVLFHMAIYPEDYPRHSNMTILVKFDGNLVQGESVFPTDERLIEMMRKSAHDVGTINIPGFQPFSGS